jgi:hypothetical protein
MSVKFDMADIAPVEVPKPKEIYFVPLIPIRKVTEYFGGPQNGEIIIDTGEISPLGGRYGKKQILWEKLQNEDS